jgi:hypothetical protein
MNSYQKFAVFFLRFAGFIIAAIGFMGPLFLAVMKVIGEQMPPFGIERWAGSIAWGIGGVLMVLVSGPLGRLLGRGLD